MSEPGKAVFLSYASQDAEAAKRICDALRAAGVEVWFDQSELVGGDAWDQKIKKQIRDCALFVPIITANTNARTEGYFRREWKLAVERTHDMADDAPFLFPIIIGDVTDATARVPDKFRDVQWTRLRLDETPAELAGRVTRLLSGEVGSVSDRSFGSSAPGKAGQRPALPRKRRLWLVPVILAAVFEGLWQQRRNHEPVVPAAAQTEAQKLVAQARQIYDTGDELNRENIFFADDLVKRALALDPAEPAAWELAAWLSYTMSWQGFDNSDARRETLMRQAARAQALAPSSVSAQLVMINARISVNFTSSALGPSKDLAESEGELLALAAREPGNWQVQRALGQTYRFLNRPDDCIPALRRAVELSQGKATAVVDLANVLVRLKRYEEAEAIIAPTLAREPTGRVRSFDLLIKCRWHGDLAGAQAALQTWPSWLLQEDRGAFWAWEAWMYSRQPDKALVAALRLQRDYLHDANFTGPRAVLTARAHELAGHAEAARAEWRTVVQHTDRELAGNPDDPAALYWKTWALMRLGETAAAQVNGTLLRQRTESNQMSFFKGTNIAALWVTTGQAELAFKAMHHQLKEFNDSYGVTRAMLELDPAYDPVRDDPRFKEIVALAPAPAPPGAGGSSSAKASPPDAKSIAVLPFANLSTDKENEFFADGVHDDVITNLAKIRDLKVISRTSVLAYRDTASRNLKRIAAELGVGSVLEGSVRRAGTRVRVTAQLIDARTDAHLWADTFDGDTSDIFALQASLAQKIAAQLKATLTPDEKTLIERHPTENPEAYESYLRGRVLEERLTQNSRIESYEEAIRAYQQAATLDPTFALAYARLTRLHGTVYWFGYLDPSPARKALVEAAVEAAQRNAPDAPETHFARGVLEYFVHTDWERALAEYRLAETGLPNDIQLQYLIAFTLRRMGRWPEALTYMERSLSRGPRDLYIASQVGGYYRALRRYDSAIEAGQRCVALFPQDSVARTILVLAQFEKDNNLPVYLQALARVPPAENDPHGLMAAYQLALVSGDLAAADRALADPRLPGITDPWVAVLSEPVAFHRARVAWLRGNTAAAKQFAEEAIAEFTRRTWTPRQRHYVAVALVEAKAYAGRGDEVVRDLPEVLADSLRRDAYGSRVCYEYAGQAYLVLGRREDALAMLRRLMNGPCFKSPNSLRIDPFWSRLKDDPRFEEILQSAKPL